MKITRVFVSGFKSLNDFDLDFEKFNCLVGVNGAGKSTVLQLLDFVSAIVSNSIYQWLDARGLLPEDIASNLHPRKRYMQIMIVFDFSDEDGVENSYFWSVALTRAGLSLRHESLSIYDQKIPGVNKYREIFSFRNDGYSFYEGTPVPMPFIILGSALAALPKNKLDAFVSPGVAGDFSKHLNAFNALKNIKSFDMLTPNLLRRKQKKDSSVLDIGLGGEYLGSFIHNLSAEQKAELLDDVRQIYPQINSIQTKVRKFGWIELSVNEVVTVGAGADEYNTALNHTAKVLNDGVLRVIAILAQKYTRHNVILFDEIENGVNSEIVQKVMDSLRLLNKQVVVTTHSPVVLNYIPESEAVKSVHLIYRGSDGASKETLFFEVPSVREKLDFLPPGDAMLDVF